MKSRLNGLGENKLAQRLARIQDDFDALKNNQAFGNTSVRLQEVKSANAYDFQTTSTYHTINCWEITYTPTGFVLDNTCFVWHIFTNGVASVGTGAQITFVELNRIVNGAWIFRYYVQGTSPSASVTWNMKVIIYAMAQGTISVSQIL